jgi:methyl-accepting chemotaxis protein
MFISNLKIGASGRCLWRSTTDGNRDRWPAEAQRHRRAEQHHHRSDWIKADAAATGQQHHAGQLGADAGTVHHRGPRPHRSIYSEIDANKKAITAALETLDKLVMRAEGKALLQEIREQRKAYVAAFTQVGKLLGSGQREAAQNALRSDMLPKLTALQETIRRLNDRQRSLVTEHGAEIEHNIRVATQLMAWLGLAAWPLVPLLPGA